jgi:hypothetical protein
MNPDRGESATNERHPGVSMIHLILLSVLDVNSTQFGCLRSGDGFSVLDDVPYEAPGNFSRTKNAWPHLMPTIHVIDVA